MRSVLRSVRKRKKSRRLGEVDLISRDKPPFSARKTDLEQTVPKTRDRGPENGPRDRSERSRTNGP